MKKGGRISQCLAWLVVGAALIVAKIKPARK
jgi:hypothetical protein